MSISNITKTEAIIMLICIGLGSVLGYRVAVTTKVITIKTIVSTIFTGDNIIITNDTATGVFGNLKIYYTAPRNLTIITQYPNYKLILLNITVNTKVAVPGRGAYTISEFNDTHIILSHISEVIVIMESDGDV